MSKTERLEVTTDELGQELRVGDYVLFTSRNYADIQLGEVTSISPKSIVAMGSRNPYMLYSYWGDPHPMRLYSGYVKASDKQIELWKIRVEKLKKRAAEEKERAQEQGE